MNRRLHSIARPAGALLLLATLGATSAWAATPAADQGARARYQREQAQCMKIAEHGARANCLSESSTRFAQTQPLKPTEAPEVLTRNALQRCVPLPDADRAACEARINGAGTVSGSVAAGGIYRELIIREVDQGVPAAAPSAGPPAVPAAPAAAPTPAPMPPMTPAAPPMPAEPPASAPMSQ